MADLTKATFEEARWALHEIAGAFRRMNDFKRAGRVQKVADGMWPKGDIIPQPVIRGRTMADKTGIEWTDATWNPIAGCDIVSKGCTHCYAMKQAARLEAMGQAKYAGLTKTVNGHPVWTGKIAVAGEPGFSQPLRWTKPRRIFVNSMSDLFHEGVSDDTIDRVFAIMALTPQHTYQVLTKRPERMRAHLESLAATHAHIATAQHMVHEGIVPLTMKISIQWPLLNVWLGVSVEDQATADARIPLLLDTPAAVRWISAEPLLGPVDLTGLEDCDNHRNLDALRGKEIGGYRAETARLDWVVIGGESGAGARPMHPDWVRQLRDQCAQAAVPFFFKQWGEHLPAEWGDDGERPFYEPDEGCSPKPAIDGALGHGYYVAAHDREYVRLGKKRTGATLDGREHKEWPR